MKKKLYIKLITVIALIFSLNSCDEFLDIRPESDLTTGNAYNTAQDLQNALNGAYRTFYTEFFQWDKIMLQDTRSDNAYSAGGGDQPLAQYDQVDISPASVRIMWGWTQLYGGIARCNIIINKVNEVSDPSLDRNNAREHILGQASWLRAWFYYNLVTHWGGVPLELESNSSDPEQTNKPRSTASEVYDQIITDLEVAVTNLPDSYSNDSAVNKVKATKGCANALLAKAWAQRKDGRDYNKVIQYCNAVINSLAGYRLLDSYDHLFDGNHYSNDEVLLEIGFVGGNWDVSNWGVQLFYDEKDGWQKYGTPSKDLVAAYDSENDEIRKNANIIFVTNVDWADENWNPCFDRNLPIPFNYKQKHPDGWNSGDRPYLLRLADIILLKAEALNETGDLNGALTAVNQVRARVDLPPITAASKEDLMWKILKERRLELAYEGQRWDDLNRLGVTVQVMTNLQEFKYTCVGGVQSDPIPVIYNVTEEKTLMPIPQLELDANPNLVQNPGYL